ncbi:hypothetical protein TNCT_672771 [Trichonephila clavata]|uniref:Uncharacterized protein n=1 Tax=Trichonephila clavata TaxID=2740835 RepID=A0A8X6M0F3_TRICU|nr:hypothetical protein TNCT_672771 [Trichonephila clavata]
MNGLLLNVTSIPTNTVVKASSSSNAHPSDFLRHGLVSKSLKLVSLKKMSSLIAAWKLVELSVYTVCVEVFFFDKSLRSQKKLVCRKVGKRFDMHGSSSGTCK